MEVTVNPVYTSVSCNRIPEIADWNCAGFICFGATNAVVVYDTNLKGKDPLTVLSHHRSIVNSVKWLRNPDGSCTELVSCSADKTAAIWTLDSGVWNVTSTLTGHKDGVTCVTGIYSNGDDLIVYTGSIDSTIKVWERRNGITAFKQTISLNSGLCLTLLAHRLPGSLPALLCALDDHKVHVFAGEDCYHRVHVLAGHEDWVRGLDVMDMDDTTILVASASQDTYIRLWRIHLYEDHQPAPGVRVETRVFAAYGRRWAVELEAVLAGHEGWVYGVQWHPGTFEGTTRKPVYRLLSSSLDKTLIIWEPEGAGEGAGDGAWVERVRVGAAGGGGLGFYGGRFGPKGDSFMGHGYNGSFHMWTLNKELNHWEPSVVCGGHFNCVEDVRWEPTLGRYLLSVGADQTTRVHAPWRRPDGQGVEWHELSRPQVHGYDLSSAALVSRDTFVSAAEEKVIRVFRAPRSFASNFRSIVGEELGGGTGDEGSESGPEGASVPALGLSNKAVFAEDEGEANTEDECNGYFVPLTFTEPPTEETLMQNTLWPEIQKLYGHGYEVFALDASPDGALVASACKATTIEHAAIITWETTNWQQVQKLTSHSLTITQLSFSPDSRQLLSVSRDRRWTLFSRKQGMEMEAVASTDKTNGVHRRIIWCCAWARDGAAFATGSREGKVCLWSKTGTPTQSSLGEYGLLGKPLEVAGASVTALAFAPTPLGRVIAAGFESGLVTLYRVEGQEWTSLYQLDNNAAHHLAVKRLMFKPQPEDASGAEVLLASCGADHLVRIHRVTISYT